MGKWLHTVCLCVCQRWYSVGSAVSVVCFGAWCVCMCVCLFETANPLSTPDPSKSHDTQLVPTRHLEDGVKG